MLNNIRTKKEIREKLRLFSEIVVAYEDELQPDSILEILNNLKKDNCKAAFQQLFSKEDFYFQVAKNIGIVNSLNSVYGLYKNKEHLSALIVDIQKTVEKYNSDDTEIDRKEQEDAKKQFIPEAYKLIKIIEREDDEDNQKELLQRLKLLYTARFFAMSSIYKSDGMNLGFMYFLKQINEIDEIKIS
jgi:hypothetical protein